MKMNNDGQLTRNVKEIVLAAVLLFLFLLLIRALLL